MKGLNGLNASRAKLLAAVSLAGLLEPWDEVGGDAFDYALNDGRLHVALFDAMGHGLGATPNAVANMGAICDHYKVFSYKAFIIVPLCGAVLIDIVAIPMITWFINAFS